MARTQIRAHQILDGGIQREDLNTTDSGKALITKIIAGTNINISETGVDSGTGDVTINASFSLLPVYDNDSWQKWRNAADNADIDVLKVDSNDDTILASESGKSILFNDKWFINDF